MVVKIIHLAIKTLKALGHVDFSASLDSANGAGYFAYVTWIAAFRSAAQPAKDVYSSQKCNGSTKGT